MKEGDWWVATDIGASVTTQGEARVSALQSLDNTIAGIDGAGREPTDEELRQIGISPNANHSREHTPQDVPDTLK